MTKMRGEYMRRSASKIFVIGFLKSLLFFILFVAISTLSYNLVMDFFGIEDTDVIEIIPPQERTAITEARLDGISKHLIYSVDDETGDINKLILEIFNSEKYKLYYITIPVKTQLTLSDSLHKELILTTPSIPQFLKLSAITGYFPKEMAYEYGILMIEDLLNIQISYYTVVPQSIYDTVFETEVIKQDSDNHQNMENAFPREVFTDGFLKYLHTINTETQLRNYIEELYSSINSNLPFKDKLNYMDSYLNTLGKNIFFEVIAGKDSNSAFIIDEPRATKQLNSYISE